MTTDQLVADNYLVPNIRQTYPRLSSDSICCSTISKCHKSVSPGTHDHDEPTPPPVQQCTTTTDAPMSQVAPSWFLQPDHYKPRLAVCQSYSGKTSGTETDCSAKAIRSHEEGSTTADPGWATAPCLGQALLTNEITQRKLRVVSGSLHCSNLYFLRRSCSSELPVASTGLAARPSKSSMRRSWWYLGHQGCHHQFTSQSNRCPFWMFHQIFWTNQDHWISLVPRNLERTSRICSFTTPWGALGCEPDPAAHPTGQLVHRVSSPVEPTSVVGWFPPPTRTVATILINPYEFIAAG